MPPAFTWKVAESGVFNGQIRGGEPLQLEALLVPPVKNLP